MLIYNKEWIDNLETREKVDGWLKKNLLTEEEHSGIVQRYLSGYHASNVFARIGMFLFTLVIVVSAVGLFNLLSFSGSQAGISIQCILFAGAYYAAAEHFVKKNHYFRSGITDALLYASVFSASLGFILILSGRNFDFNLDPIIYTAVVMPFLIFTSIRFRDAFLSLLSFAGIFTLNVLLVLKAGTFGKLILPFEGIVFSFIAFSYMRRLKKKETLRFWNKCITTLEAASLVTLYLSGNYFVVRELSEILLGANITAGNDISFAWFFYSYTLVVPLLYVWQGLKQKDHLLIRTGVLLEALGILSIRYYYSILPVETALTLAGIFLIAIAWFGISYLKLPKNGIISGEDDGSRNAAFEAIGSILVSQAAANSIHTKEESVFGGGRSGGGGAGGEF